jgi:TatD DNase family protein
MTGAQPEIQPLSVPAFDAHTHLDAMAERAGVPADAEFVDRAMSEARDVGVTAVITVGTTPQDCPWVVDAAARHPDVYAAVAIHPTEVDALTDDDYASLEALARHPRVVAIGETGLDHYWVKDADARADQEKEFRRHIELAKAVGKPLMIHDRDAHADVLRVLREEGPPDQVIFHAFSGDVDMARECVRAGWVLSFPGVVTFKNAPALREAAAVVPRESLLVETDAPFLTPHPYRGTPNSPRMLPLTVRALAHAGGHDVDQLCASISETGRRLFGLG